jgi:putative DNA primase/helicase
VSAAIINLPKPSSLRAIDVQAGELSDLVAQAQSALIATDQGIYQRGGQLVRIATLERETAQHGIRRAAGATLIMPVTRDYLPLALGRSAIWQRWDKREKAMRRIDPPAAVSTAMIASAGEWEFPTLAGITPGPTLRADGTLLDKPGYDAASQLFATFDPADFPRINPRPSREDALQALDLLDDLFGEFVFAGGPRSAHASVAVATTIAACIRHCLPTAPAAGYSARKMGSGKTTLAMATAKIATGREPPVVAPTDDETEFKKALLATLMAGDTAVIIDNIDKPVDSATLCAVLTSPTYSDRVLGVSQKVTVPTSVTWMLTGNGLEFVGDLTSRVVISVLDPEMEHPEARPFRRNLGEYVIENRGKLLAAALTIPLAYIAAGSPKVDAPRSRFSEWDARVRNPLLWLGAADPLDTQAELRATDPKRQALVAMLTAWRETFGNQPATVAEAVKEALAPGQAANVQLLDAITYVAGERNGVVNNRRLGHYLKRNVRRIEDSWRFEDVGEDPTTKNRLYRVSGVSGVLGVSSNPTRENCNANL